VNEDVDEKAEFVSWLGAEAETTSRTKSIDPSFFVVWFVHLGLGKSLIVWFCFPLSLSGRWLIGDLFWVGGG
jgi:hypothetical protein